MANLQDFKNKFKNVNLNDYDLCDAFGLIIVPKDELLEERHNAVSADEWTERGRQLEEEQWERYLEQQAHLQNEKHINSL